ncbi:MAG: Na+/H+ antiporter NhaA, partial [Parvularculaceae bacterium]|nr:Na+/H+ antiporter NhaA [Parvularculaceae bacterium]
MPVLAKIQDFLRLGSASGILLGLAALIAIFAKNSPLAPLYDGVLGVPIAVSVGAFEIAKPAHLWINDALMAIFFLLVALEIKRELLEGELSSFDKALLPLIAAAGGVIAPAVIFASINWQDPTALRGWAIPSATDIAFALGVLSLLGPRVPTSLKVFLLAIAIIDDLAAIIIIAAFYTSDLSVQSLALAAGGVASLIALNIAGVRRAAPYLLVGLVTWVFVLKSGVHATLAGVVTGLAIPMRPRGEDGQSALHQLEHGLHPWVAFGIMPLFAFANAGVSLEGLSVAALLQPVPLGIALGLFFGKQIGVFVFTWVAVMLRLVAKPAGASWVQIYGVACICGVGFTMSLFI